MTETKSLTAQSLEDSFANIPTLVVASILFAAGIVLSGLPRPTASVLALNGSTLDFQALVTQFIAGLLFVSGIVLAFIRAHLGVSTSAVFANKEAIAIGGILFTAAMTFLGLASQLQVTQPLEAGILDIVGGILILLSIVLGGTAGQTAGLAAKNA